MGYMIIISRIDGDANVFAFEDIPGLESQIEALRGARRAIDVRIAGDQEFMSAPLECPLCGDDMKVQKRRDARDSWDGSAVTAGTPAATGAGSAPATPRASPPCA